VKIYRLTDRIPVQIGDATFWLAPLSGHQQTELLQMTVLQGGEEKFRALDHAKKAISMSVKRVEGITYSDDEPYVLSFVDNDESKELTAECAEELMRLDGADKLVRVCGQFALQDIRDPKLEGVTVDFSKVQTLKKKLSIENPAS
jgi:hypothetical protein